LRQSYMRGKAELVVYKGSQWFLVARSIKNWPHGGQGKAGRKRVGQRDVASAGTRGKLKQHCLKKRGKSKEDGNCQLESAGGNPNEKNEKDRVRSDRRS